jgi:hypothetical protein
LTPRPFSERITDKLDEPGQRNPISYLIEGPHLYSESISLQQQVTNLTQEFRELEASSSSSSSKTDDHLRQQ